MLFRYFRLIIPHTVYLPRIKVTSLKLTCNSVYIYIYIYIYIPHHVTLKKYTFCQTMYLSIYFVQSRQPKLSPQERYCRETKLVLCEAGTEFLYAVEENINRWGYAALLRLLITRVTAESRV